MELDLLANITTLVEFCNNCGQCSQSCPTHYVGIFNPLGVLRAAQMGDFDGAVQSQSIFNCLTCNKCMTNCPNSKDGEGMNFAELMQNLRAYAWDKQIAVENKPKSPGIGSIVAIKLNSEGKPLEPAALNIFKYFEGRKGLKTGDSGDIAYVVGDIPLYEEQFAEVGFDYAEIPLAVVKILNQVSVTPVILNLMPTAHNELWTGQVEFFRQCAVRNVEICKQAGVKTVIVEDSDVYRTWKYDYPKFVPDFSLQVLHLSEYLTQDHNYTKLTLENDLKADFVFQDNSRLGRLGGGLYEPPRDVLRQIEGITMHELESNRNEAYDIGAGLYIETSAGSEQMWLARIHEIAQTRASYYISPSMRELTLLTHLYSEKQEALGTTHIPLLKDWAVFLSRFLH